MGQTFKKNMIKGGNIYIIVVFGDSHISVIEVELNPLLSFTSMSCSTTPNHQ